MLENQLATPGVWESRLSTKRRARSVAAKLVPLGVSTVMRNCGVSALGNRLLPTTGTRAADSRIEPPIATSAVVFGRARQYCKAGR